MKKSYILLIVVIVAALTAAGYVALSGNDESADESTTVRQESSTDATMSGQIADRSEAEATDQVEISNFNFSPATITVKKGTKVTWTNKDSVAHTVTSEDDDPLDSGLINKDGTYSFTFDKAGSFAYVCEPHSQMEGTVVVTD